mmetsp:Transcript_12883/g.45717  ORF Transcript_12883/g.45717 Transcript_12883/m.45717 type:complete len:205 (-) Transcript_12883:31-645(-)
MLDGVLLVRRRVHELLELRGLGDLDLDEPAVLERGRVDEARRVAECLVHLGDGARDGRVDVGGGLDRLDGAKRLALDDLVADVGEVDEDDVAEFAGRERGDADDARLALNLAVLVRLGEKRAQAAALRLRQRARRRATHRDAGLEQRAGEHPEGSLWSELRSAFFENLQSKLPHDSERSICSDQVGPASARRVQLDDPTRVTRI